MSKFNCAETFRRLQDYLDRELSEQELELVEEHLAECGVCAEDFRFEASVLTWCRRELVLEPVPADLFGQLVAGIRKSTPGS